MATQIRLLRWIIGLLLFAAALVFAFRLGNWYGRAEVYGRIVQEKMP